MFADRNGGYTRIVRLGTGRPGDNSPRAVLQLVGKEESPGSVTRPETGARRTRADARNTAAAEAGAAGEARKSQKPAPAAGVEAPAAPEPAPGDASAPGA